MTNDFESVMMMLFTAKWNIPKASEALKKPVNKESWEETKEAFREYCRYHPSTWPG